MSNVGKSTDTSKSHRSGTPAQSQSSKGLEKKSNVKPTGSHSLKEEVWERVGNKHSNLPPINGHTGVFAYHMDDCMCSMAGWPCYRDGLIWSCCGSTDKNSYCPNAEKK